MFRVLKGGNCFAPEYIGQKDIFLIYDKIFKIADEIHEENIFDAEIIDCSGSIVCPGFIDQHLHITGGGGEDGPSSRVPEITAGEIFLAGISTAAGLLGADGITRNIAGLLAKANALQIEGLNAVIYTGSYGVPTTTLTGRVISDLSYIDKIIGVGEIAISDYRSSHPSEQMLKELAWEAKVGGMIGKKAGIMHIHVGDGKKGIEPIISLINNSDFPMNMFVPTHLNRNMNVFGQAVEFAKTGGNIDLTAGEKTGKGYSVPDAVSNLISSGVGIDRITVSSDGNGSIPPGDSSGQKVGKVSQLYDDIKACVFDKKIEISDALRLVTENTAKLLGLYPKKGTLKEQSDADILILDKEDLSIKGLIVNGNMVVLSLIHI